MKKKDAVASLVTPYPAPARLARNLLAGTSVFRSKDTEPVTLSQRIGQAAFRENRHHIVPKIQKYPCTPKELFRSKSGEQIVEPVVSDNGSILMTLMPKGDLILLCEHGISILPKTLTPFPVRAKAMHKGICYLLERDGTRICTLDEHANLLGTNHALTRSGVTRPTSFCFYEERIGVISWPEKTVTILDKHWHFLSRFQICWADFLFHPAGIQDTLFAVNTPSSSRGIGGIIGIDPTGKISSLYDGLMTPLGLCTDGELLICGHAFGLSFFRPKESRADLIGTIDVMDLCRVHGTDHTVAITYVMHHNQSLLVFCDILTAGISGPGTSLLLQINLDECLAVLEGKER